MRSVLMAGVCVALGLAEAALAQCGRADPFVPRQEVVRVAPGHTIEEFLALANADPMLNGTVFTVADSIPRRPIYLLDVQLGTGMSEQTVDLRLNTYYVQQRGILAWAELEYVSKTHEGQTGSIYVSRGGNFHPVYIAQYAVAQLGLAQAHQRSTGRAVAVAVLDTGVDAAHPALLGRVLPLGFNFVNNSPDTRDIGDGLDNDGDDQIDEQVGHGTFVAGLVSLVAPEARLLPVVVIDSDGGGRNFPVGKGMFYAIDRGVEIINMSLGSTYDSMCVQEAAREALNLGIVIVAPAGNCNLDLDRFNEFREYPGLFEDRFPEPPEIMHDAVGVTAVDHDDLKAAFANYCRRVNLSAPGASLRLGQGQYDNSRSIISLIPGGQYAIWEGTSFSAALVSGVYALVRAQHPEWRSQLSTYDNLQTAVLAGAVDIDARNPLYARQLGRGRVSAANAVAPGPPQPRLGDLNNDGRIDQQDLGVLLADWGTVHSPADLDNDGLVGQGDLGILLAGWGG